MSMTDPIADFITRIRNGVAARKAKIDLPASNFKVKLAEILREEGFITGFTVQGEEVGRTMTVSLRYDSHAKSAINGIRRTSRPGQRVYVGTDAIPRVRSGLGVAILTTSRGVMTDREARKQGLGGEILCEIW
jgi:small subunit ribosomal protein S8